MAQLVVRNLDGDVKERLRERAARHGRSMEEEVREILRDAVLKANEPEVGLGTAMVRLFRGIGFRPGEFEEMRGEFFRPAEFDE
ncbi:MAG: FitA-like ribbon-helix-helix domain-containing protein [Thermomicrobiales bacterium]